MLETPDAQIDLAKVKLTIDQMIDPRIDVAAALKQLDAMANALKSRLPSGASSSEKLDALRAFLYEPGAWNEHRPFRYDLDDPFGRIIGNKLLPTYVATRKGNCVSMPFLVIILGQKIGLDVTAATAPEHIFVKYRDEQGALYNLETTSGAGFTSDAWIQKQIAMSPEALANGIYLQPLTKKETVVLMATTLMEFHGQQGQQEDRIALANLALEYHPRSVEVIMQMHAAYGRMLEREFQGKYASPRHIPPEHRARFMELDHAAQLWLGKAEALGWRPPGETMDANYVRVVDQAKAAQMKGATK